MRTLTYSATTALLAVAILLGATSANAGCGCDKPRPGPSQVLPHVTYAGMPVRLVSSALVAGQAYTVTFTAGTATASATVTGTAEVRRDLTDAVYKPQVTVPLPALPLGPAAITVRAQASGALITTISDAEFTVAPAPIALPTSYGTFTYPDYQAAIGRDGTIYIALELTGLDNPMVFEAQAKGYALRFGNEDVVFYNTQGFVMQRLVDDSSKKAVVVPGMFVFPAGSASPDGDLLHYSRHEFSTYFLQHAERQPHAADATDAQWHTDGTPHIDHDHLILAVAGTVGGAVPKAGTTPTFTLSLGAHSLFRDGITATASVSLETGAVVDSYVPGQFGLSENGDVFSAGTVKIASGTTVKGDVTGTKLQIAADALVTGDRYVLKSVPTFMSVKVPANLPDLGAVNLAGGFRTIQGPGSFVASSLSLEKWSLLTIDNSTGPVTLYVTGPITLDSLSSITVRNPDPEQFAIYVAGNAPVSLAGSFASFFYGVIYAPQSTVTIAQGASFSGAFVGKSVVSAGYVHYDSLLRSTSDLVDMLLAADGDGSTQLTTTQSAPTATATATPTPTPKPTATPTSRTTSKTGTTKKSAR